MIFVNKYKRRIEVARWKANIKLKEIEREKAIYGTYKQVSQQVNCIVWAGHLQEKIDLLDALLKGKEIKF